MGMQSICVYGLLIVLVSMGSARSQSSPCPDNFIYQFTGSEWIAYVIINNPPQNTNLTTLVALTVTRPIQSGYIGKLELFGTFEESVMMIRDQNKIIYKVGFPIQDPIPQLKFINVNNNIICQGHQATEGYVLTVTLRHVLGYTLGHSNTNYLGANYFGAQHITQTNDLNSGFLPQQNPDMFQQPQQVPMLQQPTQQFLQPTQAQKPFLQPQTIQQQFLQPQQKPVKPQWRPPVRTTTTTPEPEITNFDSNTPNSDTAPPTSSDKINRFLDNCGLPLNHIPLIHGGSEPGRDQYLWLSSVFKSRDGSLNFTCGGSLITDRHVLTAAHCVQNRYGDKIPSSELVVMVGKFNINDWDQTGVFTSAVHHYYVHERYNKGGKLNDDIAMLVFTKTVDFVQFTNIRTVCLWSMDSSISTIVGQQGVVVGWGKDETGRQTTSTPRELRVPIVSQEDCLYSEAKHYTTNKTLCAGSKDGNGPCTGDSGGGLFMWVGGRYFIRGIISLSLVDQNTYSCNLNEYSIYTDVAQYLPWIEKKVDSY